MGEAGNLHEGDHQLSLLALIYVPWEMVVLFWKEEVVGKSSESCPWLAQETGRPSGRWP